MLHYGPVPRIDLASWSLQVLGETADGRTHSWDWDELARLPRTVVEADFHCVTKFSVFDNTWEGVALRTVLDLAPPAPDVTHVMLWAEYGYGANVRLADIDRPDALLATHRNGEPLTRDHGAPLRAILPHLYAWKGPKWLRGIEWMTEDRRGFWEERGYHNLADPWREQRYSYQEEPGDGPD